MSDHALKPEPGWNQLPYSLTFTYRPKFEALCTCLALGHLGAHQLSELLGNVEWIEATVFTIKDIVLRRELNKLGKLFATCTLGGTCTSGSTYYAGCPSKVIVMR
jgi:hypothetical protein